MSQHQETAPAAPGPVDRPVRPVAGPNVRRMLRAARLCEELGHAGDTLAALEELKRLREQNAELLLLIQRVAKYPASVDCAGTLLRSDLLRAAGPRETWKA